MTAPKKPRNSGPRNANRKPAKSAVGNAIEPPKPNRPTANERMVFLQSELYERIKRQGDTP